MHVLHLFSEEGYRDHAKGCGECKITSSAW